MKVKWLTIKSPCRKFQFHLFISGGEDKILYCLIDMTCTILIAKTPSLSLIRTLNFLQSHIFTTLKKDMSYNSLHQKKLGFLFLTKVCPIKVSKIPFTGFVIVPVMCIFFSVIFDYHNLHNQGMHRSTANPMSSYRWSLVENVEEIVPSLINSGNVCTLLTTAFQNFVLQISLTLQLKTLLITLKVCQFLSLLMDCMIAMFVVPTIKNHGH